MLGIVLTNMTSIRVILACLLVPSALGAEQCHVSAGSNTCPDQASLLQAQINVDGGDGETQVKKGTKKEEAEVEEGKKEDEAKANVANVDWTGDDDDDTWTGGNVNCHQKWVTHEGRYVQQGHGSTSECYDEETAKQKCVEASDCHAIATQSNICGGQYRVTHGGPSLKPVISRYPNWQHWGMKAFTTRRRCPTGTTTAAPTQSAPIAKITKQAVSNAFHSLADDDNFISAVTDQFNAFHSLEDDDNFLSAVTDQLVHQQQQQ